MPDVAGKSALTRLWLGCGKGVCSDMTHAAWDLRCGFCSAGVLGFRTPLS